MGKCREEYTNPKTDNQREKSGREPTELILKVQYFDCQNSREKY